MQWPFQPDFSRALSRVHGAMFGVLLLIASSVAQAGPTANARAALRAGTKAFKAKKYSAALAAFRKAEPHGALIGELAAIRWNIARTLEELGQYEEVLPALERCLEVAPTAAGRARVQKKIRAIRKRLFGSIQIICKNTGVRVAIDSAALQACPKTVADLRPGQYVVRAELSNRPYPPMKATVKAGRVSKIRVPEAGRVQLFGAPGQTVRLSGTSLGKVPLTTPELPPGRYTFSVGEDWRPTVDLRAGQRVKLSPNQTASTAAAPSWQTVRPWVASGGAAVLLLTSTWFFVDASDDWDMAKDFAAQHRAATTADQKARLQQRAEASASDSQRNQVIGGVALLGGLAAAGLAWWWFDDAHVAIAPNQLMLQLRY